MISFIIIFFKRMNLNILFNRDQQPIPESTSPRKDNAKVNKRKNANELIEKSKEQWRKMVDAKFKKSIVNKTYKFPRDK